MIDKTLGIIKLILSAVLIGFICYNAFFIENTLRAIFEMLVLIFLWRND
jgi:hypothetical protein